MTQQNLPPQTQPDAQTTQVPKGLAISALVVGIVGFLMGLIPVAGALVGVAAVILGAIALSKKQPKAFALTGLILGACAALASISTTVGVGALTNELAKSAPSSTTAQESQSTAPSEQTETTPSAPATPEKKERLTLDEGWTTETDDYGMFTKVLGYVSNNSDKAVTNYVQITFDTLDEAGANLGSCLANANTIDANGKWKFEAICSADASSIAEVRFKEISGF